MTKLLLVGAMLLVSGLLPFLTSSHYFLGIGVSAAIFTVAASALNLVYGYAGLLSFAQLGFWGIGGYAAALTVATFGGSFWQGLFWAAAVNAAVALAVGYPALRTGRHAFVIMTLAFALLVTLIARDWVSLTRGPLGIPGLPAPSLFGFGFSTPARMFWLAWSYAVLALAFLYALATSRIGRTLVAIKQNEPLARAQGVAPTPYKLAAFTIGAALTGVAGGIYTFYLRIIDPSFLDFYYMQTFLIMVILGGAGSFWSVVLAGIALAALPELLRFSADLRMILYGAVLLLAMLALPGGIAGWIEARNTSRMRAAFPK
jgi:branched-chain amino acid transport system permease protein